MTEVLSQPVAHALARALGHFIWQGAAIGLVTLIAFRVFRNSASARYVSGVAGLAAMLIVPVFTYLAASVDSVAVAGQSLSTAIPPASGGLTTLVISTNGPSVTVQTDWLFVAVLAWMLGATALTLRLAGGWIVARRYATRAIQPASEQVVALARQLADRMGVDRAVAVVQSTLVPVPVMVGWLKPTIVLPVAALSGLNPSQIEALIAHELAHVRRHDYLVNLLQSIVEALLFYHPAVWWLSRRVRTERELCCDDLAVSVCDRLVYATALTDLASIASSRVALAATDGDLLSRVRRILGRGESAAPAPRSAMPLLVLAFVGAMIVPAALASVPQSQHQPGETHVALPSAVHDAIHPQTTPKPSPKPTTTPQELTPAEREALKKRMDEMAEVLRAKLANVDGQALQQSLVDMRKAIDEMAQTDLKHRALAQEDLKKVIEHSVEQRHLATAEIEQATRQLEETKRLFERGLVSQAQLRDAQIALEKAGAQGDPFAELKADLNNMRANLERSQALLEKGLISNQQVQDLQANVARAEQRLLQSSASRAQLEQTIASTMADHVKTATDARALYELLATRQHLAGDTEAALKKNAQGALMEQQQLLEKQRLLEQQRAHVADEQATQKHTTATVKEMTVKEMLDARATLERGSGNLAPSEALQPLDFLRITISGEPDVPSGYTVNPDGTIRFPFIGSVKVGGLTVAQVREAIGKRLSERKLGSAEKVTVIAARPRK